MTIPVCATCKTRCERRFSSSQGARADLDNNDMLVFDLVHAIQIVGEAASKVSPQTREGHAHVPWAAIIGMRHRLVHAYFDINRDISWTTETEAVPDLLAQIEPLLDAE